MLPAIEDFRVKTLSIFAYTVINKLLKCREGKYFLFSVVRRGEINRIIPFIVTLLNS